ncbi:MAG: PAS domain S-box protein [Planctomycetes bacterium]|nr:PAS domain S-box protein [Planctomycetota bacterium]
MADWLYWTAGIVAAALAGAAFARAATRRTGPPLAPVPSPPPAPVVSEPPAPEVPYRLLFDIHPAPLWAFDEASLRFLATNGAVHARYGYTSDELLSLTVRDVLARPCADALIGGLNADALFPDDVLVWEHRTKAGAVLPLEVVTARFEYGGRPARLVVATDLTDRRRAETALRASEGRLRDVLANIPCGVFWKDRASIYLECNDRVARDYGRDVAGEVVGRTDDDFLTPDAAEYARACDRSVMESGEPLLNTDEVRPGADGKASQLLVSRVPLRDGAGALIGVLGVYQDVTEHKRLEAQFRQAQKMEAIGRLAGGIAHDFNNLLTIITGNTHLLQHLPPGDPEQPQLIEDINDAATRAAALTRQLLTFSRKQPTRPEVIDLNEIVSGLSSLLRRLIGERVTVRTELAPNPVRVRADRGQIEQVVMNLAVNAKDAMPDGGTLTIGTGELAGAGRFARLVVRDTGTGMTAEVKRHLFEPFFTTKDIGKGTGLGLATVYGIVQQSGGAIEVESELAVGTTFDVRFPWCDGAARSSAEISGLGLSGRTGFSFRRTVLLVEDEERLRKMVRLTLETQGCVVTEANGGEAALALLTPERHFDLLVTDLVMPGIDGRELAARARAVRPDLPIVFVSGYVPDQRRLEGLARAVFLPKPFTPGELVKTVERLFRPAKGAPVAGGVT